MIETKDIPKKRDYFTDNSWRHLSKCMSGYEQKDDMSVAVWSAVFSESILKDYQTDFRLKKSNKDELMQLISQVQGYMASPKCTLSENEKNYIIDITDRADEIRKIRNRLLHDRGIENEGFQSDVNHMFTAIQQIITDYLNTSLSNEIYLSNIQNKNTPKGNITEPYFPVFISTITPHTFEQNAFIEGFCGRLEEIGVIPVRCEFNEYDNQDPMGKVKDYIEKCHAFISVGLERSHVYYFRDKEGSPDQNESLHRRYTSSWLQLEAGMACALEKKIFVLCQKDLYDDGIYDRSWNSYRPVVELSLPLDIYDVHIDRMLEELKKYMNTFKEINEPSQ